MNGNKKAIANCWRTASTFSLQHAAARTSANFSGFVSICYLEKKKDNRNWTRNSLLFNLPKHTLLTHPGRTIAIQRLKISLKMPQSDKRNGSTLTRSPKRNQPIPSTPYKQGELNSSPHNENTQGGGTYSLRVVHTVSREETQKMLQGIIKPLREGIMPTTGFESLVTLPYLTLLSPSWSCVIETWTDANRSRKSRYSSEQGHRDSEGIGRQSPWLHKLNALQRLTLRYRITARAGALMEICDERFARRGSSLGTDSIRTGSHTTSWLASLLCS